MLHIQATRLILLDSYLSSDCTAYCQFGVQQLCFSALSVHVHVKWNITQRLCVIVI